MQLKSVIYVSMMALALFAKDLYAYESFGLSTEQQHCFSNAMVGMDSVINSRLGLPPEHVLDITRINNYPAGSEVRFDNELLNVMLDAYLWQTSPHSYAIKVFYDCAQQTLFQRQAKLAH